MRIDISYFKRPLDFLRLPELVITHRIARIAQTLHSTARAAMATTASPPLQLATASRPHASASGGGGVGGVLLTGGSGGGVAPGRGRGRMQRRVSARSVASDRDAQGPVSPAEGTWLRPPAGPGALGEVW